jgi:hypothetical protein
MELSMHTVPGARQSMSAHSKGDRGAVSDAAFVGAALSSGGEWFWGNPRDVRLEPVPALDLDGSGVQFHVRPDVGPAAGVC